MHNDYLDEGRSHYGYIKPLMCESCEQQCEQGTSLRVFADLKEWRGRRRAVFRLLHTSCFDKRLGQADFVVTNV